MKKLMNFLQKSFVVLMVCLIITNTVTPLPAVPEYGEESGYSTCALPGPDPEPDPDENPFGEDNGHD